MKALGTGVVGSNGRSSRSTSPHLYPRTEETQHSLVNGWGSQSSLVAPTPPPLTSGDKGSVYTHPAPPEWGAPAAGVSSPWEPRPAPLGSA